MALYNVGNLESIVQSFTKGQEYLSDVDLDIVPEENTIDPLDALRFYQGDRDLEKSLKLAEIFCVNKKVAFTKGAKALLEFTPLQGKPIQSYMKEAPYLLDILCSAVWGILLKKLTPPSEDSASDGGSSQ